MKNLKRRLEAFSFYDHTGIEKHLEDMASKGWMLTGINKLTWNYERIEPKKIHFAVTYYPKASEFDPEPLEGQRIYWDYSERTGWKHICTSAQMQIFYSEVDDPVPMETDPVIEVDMIHKAAKRAYLKSYYLLLVIAVLQAALFVSRLLGDPIGLLSSSTQLATGFLWGLLLILCTVEVAGYHLWHRKAVRAADSGEFLETHGHGLLQKLVLVAAVAALVYIVINLISAGNKVQVTLYLLLLAGSFGLVVIVANIKELLKKKKASRNVNFTITLVVDIILAVAMAAGFTYGIFHAVGAGALDNAFNTEGLLHQVEPPLVIEDLQDISFDGYVKANRQDESIFLGQRGLNQWPRFENGQHVQVPEMKYTVTVVKIPAVYDLCKNSILNKRKDKVQDDGTVFIDHYEDIDAAPWLAEEAYQLHWSEGILYKYLLCYDDRLIEIEFDWEPTEEQMRIVSEKLTGY